TFLHDKVVSPSSPSLISFRAIPDLMSTASPCQPNAPVTRQARQNPSPNRSRSWSASSASALSWRRRSTQRVPSSCLSLYGDVGLSTFPLLGSSPFPFSRATVNNARPRFCQKVYDETNYFTSADPIDVYKNHLHYEVV